MEKNRKTELFFEKHDGEIDLYRNHPTHPAPLAFGKRDGIAKLFMLISKFLEDEMKDGQALYLSIEIGNLLDDGQD